MYAIVDIAGQQFKVEKGKKIFVHRLSGDAGAVISFDKVLLIGSKDKVSVGAPYISKAVVTAQILTHLRGDKIQVFKKKRRKGYQVLNGHRQELTQILIDEISETGLVSKTGAKKEAEPVKKVETQKMDVSTVEVVTPVKKETAASTAEKKPSGPAEKKEVEAPREMKQETAKPKKAAAASRAPATKKTTAKTSPVSAEPAKKSVSKVATGKAESKSKPAAKKTAVKKPAEKKK